MSAPVSKTLPSHKLCVEGAMGLLVVYFVSVVVGQAVSVGLGLLVERFYSSYAGLLVFIACFFFVFWLAWQIAVRLTEPKAPQQQN
jgi:cyanate permease